MAAPSFERAVSHVIASEGGYVDHPRDPGGATKYGVTLQTLGRWRGRPVSKQEVKALTEGEAKLIYRKFYWDRIKGDELPAGVDLAVFDFAVNSGEGRAVKYLQALVDVSADGVIGSATLKAVGKKEPVALIRSLTKSRLAYLQSLKALWPVFGKGWRKRVLSVEAEALDMAGKSLPPPDIEPIDSPNSNWLVALLRAIFKRKAA